MKKILLARHMAFGDCLLITPFLRQIYEKHADAQIDVYSGYDFFLHYPEVHNWINARKTFLSNLVSNYDEVYLFNYEHAPRRHILDGYEYSSGLSLRNDCPYVPNIDSKRQAEILSNYHLSSKKYIVFAPFAGNSARSLMLHNILDILSMLQRKFPEYQIVIYHSWRRYFSNVVNICDNRPFPEMVAVMQNAAVLLSVDTGFWHLAQACGTPSIVLAGQTDPRLRVSKRDSTAILQANIRCIGCYHRHIGTFGDKFKTCLRGDWACKNDLKLNELENLMEKILSGKKLKPCPSLRKNALRYAEFTALQEFGDINQQSIRRHYFLILENFTRQSKFKFLKLMIPKPLLRWGYRTFVKPVLRKVSTSIK